MTEIKRDSQGNIVLLMDDRKKEIAKWNPELEQRLKEQANFHNPKGNLKEIDLVSSEEVGYGLIIEYPEEFREYYRGPWYDTDEMTGFQAAYNAAKEMMGWNRVGTQIFIIKDIKLLRKEFSQ